MSDAADEPKYTTQEVTARLRALPLPLDPDSFLIKVVKCDGCTGGRGDSIAEDPDDFGVSSCCDGHGVRLEVTDGLEPLVLLLSARAYDAWEDEHRRTRSRNSAERLDLTYAVEEAVGPDLVDWPPHEHGARVAPMWEGSPEQLLDRAIAEGRA